MNTFNSKLSSQYSLRQLSKRELILSAQKAVTKEREATSVVLEHLYEIERRRLYAEAGFSSLHEFAVRMLKYSDAAAARRIAAMRLIKAAPEVKASIDSGELSLTNAAMAYGVLKQARHSKTTLPVTPTALAQTVMNCSSREAERKLRTIAPALAPTHDRVRIQDGDNSVMTVNVSNELAQKLKALRARHAHKVGDATLGELLEFAVDRALAVTAPAPELAQVFTNESQTRSVPTHQTPVSAQSRTSPTKSARPSRYIPVAIQRNQNKTTGQCQFQSPLTGQKCQSTFALQFDHKIPLARSGATTAQNIQLLCAAHNRWKGARPTGSGASA